jgi:hypothetical protein
VEYLQDNVATFFIARTIGPSMYVFIQDDDMGKVYGLLFVVLFSDDDALIQQHVFPKRDDFLWSSF